MEALNFHRDCASKDLPRWVQWTRSRERMFEKNLELCLDILFPRNNSKEVASPELVVVMDEQNFVCRYLTSHDRSGPTNIDSQLRECGVVMILMFSAKSADLALL